MARAVVSGSASVSRSFVKPTGEPSEAVPLRRSVVQGEDSASVADRTEQASRLEKKFEQLAAQWREDTFFLSSVEDMATHPAYQRIIGMGKEAVPLILRRLRRRPEHWFWALTAITGEDPVPASDRGNVHKMAHAWIAWGKARGHLD